MATGRPDDASESEIEIAQIACNAGVSKEAYLELRVRAVQQSALLGGWSPQVLAATLSNVRQIAERVYDPTTVWTTHPVTVTRAAMAVLEELRMSDVWKEPPLQLASGDFALALDDDAYQRIQLLRRPKESVSDVVLRMYRGRP